MVHARVLSIKAALCNAEMSLLIHRCHLHNVYPEMLDIRVAALLHSLVAELSRCTVPTRVTQSISCHVVKGCA